MPLEEEVPLFLTIGFVTIMILFALCIIALWVRDKGTHSHTSYIMIVLHLLLLSIAFYFFMNAITLELDYDHPMASEENTLQLAIATGCWGLSMISLLLALFKFANSSGSKKQAPL